MKSLRLRLLGLLGVAILVAAIALLISSYRAAIQEVNTLFDYHMQQLANVFKDDIQGSGSERRTKDNYAEKFEIAIQFWGPNGESVYQSRFYTEQPPRGESGLSTVTLPNGDWRLYVAQSAKGTVQIAQRMDARRRHASAMAAQAIWPLIPLSLLIFAAAWWVISLSLLPLKKVIDDLHNRTLDNDWPVAIEDIPDEVAPLVVELNSLLYRGGREMQAQQRFLSDATHELRSPLTALKLQVQNLARAKDPASRESAIQRLLGGVDRATRLVEQLLALVRQDKQGRGIVSVLTSLSSCVEMALLDVRSLASARNIKLKVAELPQADVIGDPDSLTVLTRNLLDNAVRYTPEHGEIRVDIDLASSAATLIVEDSGPGISETNRQRVFDRFFRVPGSGTNGSGLGLAIVKAIADSHGAFVWLGQSEFGGLMVKVAFPIKPGKSTVVEGDASHLYRANRGE